MPGHGKKGSIEMPLGQFYGGKFIFLTREWWGFVLLFILLVTSCVG